MKQIKSYLIFKESLTLTSADINSSDDNLTAMKNNIDEYNNKKASLNAIYMNYKDEKDLISKLKSSKFIPSDNNPDVKTINFINPLLGLYAQVCQKNRLLKNTQDKLADYQKQLNDKTTYMRNNPSQMDSTKTDINAINVNIQNTKRDITQISQDTIQLQKMATDKLNEMQKNLITSQSHNNSK